jgi:mannose-6-phosphate isomerase-like protein (cupin superfamily)
MRRERLSPHLHHREDEGFVVMPGEVRFYLGEQTIELKSGEYLLGPKGNFTSF